MVEPHVSLTMRAGHGIFSIEVCSWPLTIGNSSTHPLETTCSYGDFGQATTLVDMKMCQSGLQIEDLPKGKRFKFPFHGKGAVTDEWSKVL